nr:S-adenosylmethionine mitochondrial carrier protein-like [Ciona intestinalis]|eukprot:XP_004225486.1 S-adenosylmethionine mitochondrial carrier protein-like [Ciona intestinalis]
MVNEWMTALASGAVAGFCVDVTLFPVDTVKTRLQSSQGFIKAGGFKRIYSGIGPAALGSAPGAAVFFTAYDTTRNLLKKPDRSFGHNLAVDMTAASVGEVVACLIRVPVEVIKQRSQVTKNANSFRIFLSCIRTEGVRGMYRGYRSTVVREIPFSLIQFPLWEFLKVTVAKYRGKESPDAIESAVCGFFSGGIAAAVTTPLDVAKTRIILAQTNDSAAAGNILPVLREVWSTGGARALFAGVLPRVVWISVGGFVFLGMYDTTKSLLNGL